MTPFGHLVREVTPYGLLSLGDQLVTYQCHHGSLFLDQTVSDALGGEGWAVRRQAAFEAAHALLASFYAEFGVIASGPSAAGSRSFASVIPARSARRWRTTCGSGACASR